MRTPKVANLAVVHKIDALTDEIEELESAIEHIRVTVATAVSPDLRRVAQGRLEAWTADLAKLRKQRASLKTFYYPGRHGGLTRYKNGCRCDRCVDAVREWRRERLRLYREARIEMDGVMVYPAAPHGTLAGYARYTCRCADCAQVAREYRKLYRKQKEAS